MLWKPDSRQTFHLLFDISSDRSSHQPSSRRVHTSDMADSTKAQQPQTGSSSAQQQQQAPAANKDLPSLGPLDEDDEFEEFEVQGEFARWSQDSGGRDRG